MCFNIGCKFVKICWTRLKGKNLPTTFSMTVDFIIFLICFNLLTPKSDLHLISPYNITTESHINVMRIKEMITNERNS